MDTSKTPPGSTDPVANPPAAKHDEGSYLQGQGRSPFTDKSSGPSVREGEAISDDILDSFLGGSDAPDTHKDPADKA